MRASRRGPEWWDQLDKQAHPDLVAADDWVPSGTNFFTDKLFACQSLLKLSTDKQKAWQAYQKAKNIHALTRKTHVKIQKIWKWMAEPSYCWQVFHLSMVSKNKDFPEINSSFVTWQVKHLSALRVLFEFCMHWQDFFFSVNVTWFTVKKKACQH